MAYFKVTYTGNATRLQGLNYTCVAKTPREAVEVVYRKVLDDNYFPEDPSTFGSIIRDCDGNVVANENDNTIEFDGGYFIAELMEN